MLKTIEKRTSIRSYQAKSLSNADQNLLKEIINRVEIKKGPFNHQARFFYVNNTNKNKQTIGTYGFVKNPPAFIGGITKNTSKAMVDFGFLFEEIILHLTKQDIGTVWLGGTFHRKDFSLQVYEDEMIAAISPVGYPAVPSLREKAIRKITKADKRLDFETLFFSGKELAAIKDSNPYYKYFQAVQYAPSASNKQPWRIVLIDNTFHLYLKRTKGYRGKLQMDIQSIDIGIALFHLYITLKEDGYNLEFIHQSPLKLDLSEYIISLKASKS
ncbi:hypothetical protein KHQ88_07035 [Mycoplasmatota bacterium]|nr:hypothetical protein KHQ88_07035 [Mycoplasmatota bacterium]